MIKEKYFMVLLAENNHGKGTVLESMVIKANSHLTRKGEKRLQFSNRIVNAFVFRRSFQEVEKSKYPTPFDALVGNFEEQNIQEDWYDKELIIMPSHANQRESCYNDVVQMMETAQQYGYNTLLAYIMMDKATDYAEYEDILKLNWDKKWELVNPRTANHLQECLSLGKDLFDKLDKLF
ncbi:hypothetical protein [Gottfriedia acidiceleris]|uniref:hypothetical protein n=1 Tax=Gottfriedia acidiceleris TaxID=371036 RepID=UPI003D240E25